MSTAWRASAPGIPSSTSRGHWPCRSASASVVTLRAVDPSRVTRCATGSRSAHRATTKSRKSSSAVAVIRTASARRARGRGGHGRCGGPRWPIRRPEGAAPHEPERRGVVGVDDVDDGDATGAGADHLGHRVGVGRGRQQLHPGGAGGDDEEAARPGGARPPAASTTGSSAGGVGGQHGRRLEVEPVEPGAAVVDDAHGTDDQPVPRRACAAPAPRRRRPARDICGRVDDATTDLRRR